MVKIASNIDVANKAVAGVKSVILNKGQQVTLRKSTV